MPDALGQVTVELPASQALAVPVQVRDSRMKLVHELRAGETVGLPEGLYVFAALLPTGEKASQVVNVQPAQGAQSVALQLPESELSGSEVLRRIGRLLTDADSSDLPDSGELRRPGWFIRFEPNAPPPQIKVIESLATDASAFLVAEISVSRPTVTFMQLASAGRVPRNFALPAAPHSRSDTCTLEVVAEETLTVKLSLDGPAHQIAEYLRRGNLIAAAEVAGSAERLLMGKVHDPVGAAVGGYALLRLNLLERLHKWPQNLSAWFEWLPDGAVIAGETAFRRGEHELALEQLTLAAERGLPMFADGFSMLLSRLNAYLHASELPSKVVRDKSQAMAEHVEHLTQLAPFVDFSALVLSFRGSDIGDAAASQRPLDHFGEGSGWVPLETPNRVLARRD